MRRRLPALFLTLSLLAFLTLFYLNSHWLYLLIHVPAAMLAYLGFGLCIAVNLVFLYTQRIDQRFGHIAAELGLVFASITIMSGALWGLEAWGKAWIWEPRLMGLLLTTLIFASWRLAQSQIAMHSNKNASISAKLIVLGLPALVFTHVAVRFLGGVHPDSLPPEAVREGVHAGMWYLASIAQIALAFSFVTWRLNSKDSKQENPS